MFDWNSFTKLSKSLEKYSKRSKVKEAFLRSAVSRGYYAIYHATKDYSEKKLAYNYRILSNRYKRLGVHVYGSHQVLIHFLKTQSDPTLKVLGTELETCRDCRTECDYEASASIDRNYVKSFFIKSDGVRSTIVSLP